ncbi:hypothetical protein DEM27_08230 [Metarhizobium album]|uniref:Uncharacterized protein n=1 Tax=Metarhizobium album TaxID=2182425 RepID=A0A2U2DSV5_9HYPH|nr:hypothetical protein [Rhizobium album]PWE56378.1 hypothetical protein DEM27_08230 [Rhizobium album]
MRKLIVAACLTLVASGAVCQELKLSVPGKGKKTTEVHDFKLVPVTKLLMRPTDIEPDDVQLYCSPSWQGVVVAIGNRLIAIDQDAIASLKRKPKGEVNGKRTKLIDAKASESPLRDYPDTISKLAKRGDRECEVKETPDMSVPETAVIATPESSIDAAYLICAAVDASGIASKPCDVSGWNSAIQITMDVRGAEAKIICNQLSAAARKNGRVFQGGWKIEIYSPFSDGNTVAYCNL